MAPALLKHANIPIQVDAVLWDIERCVNCPRVACCCVLIAAYRHGTLERFLKEKTGVDEESILAYLPDGHRLRNENLRDLAGAETQVRS